MIDVTDKLDDSVLVEIFKEALTEIDLVVKLQNEVVYSHLPRMNLIAYLSDLGGLFSLWLGVSIYALYEAFEKAFEYFKEKKKRKESQENKMNSKPELKKSDGTEEVKDSNKDAKSQDLDETLHAFIVHLEMMQKSKMGKTINV